MLGKPTYCSVSRTCRRAFVVGAWAVVEQLLFRSMIVSRQAASCWPLFFNLHSSVFFWKRYPRADFGNQRKEKKRKKIFIVIIIHLGFMFPEQKLDFRTFPLPKPEQTWTNLNKQKHENLVWLACLWFPYTQQCCAYAFWWRPHRNCSQWTAHVHMICSCEQPLWTVACETKKDTTHSCVKVVANFRLLMSTTKLAASSWLPWLSCCRESVSNLLKRW